MLCALAIWAGTCDPEAARTAAPPDLMRLVPVELNSNGWPSRAWTRTLNELAAPPREDVSDSS